ncbi:centriole and centriolar satellite protein OFD1-like [Lytechinus pictus]|uniref:centriole and centriolar satellite protein OFD1-like n=1 Tax=Lytechinus pictus TaxID=7653 RepID=UPI0030BA0E12
MDSDTQPMSAGELKTRLYHTFRERGLVESLKSQLRTKLVTELRQSAGLQHVKFASSPSSMLTASLDGSSSLMLRAANSLVVDHLRRCGYDYSVAVFMPESGATDDKMFTLPDLLDLLRIAPSSRLYKKLAAELPSIDPKGFLWQLLTELSASQARKQEHVGIQVDTHPIHQSSLERKLQSVDDVYNQRSEEDEILNRHAIQEKLLKLKREMEIRSREEIHREISRFKESALKRVELEEREKARKEIASARREIENTYQAKSDALRERELSTMERIQKHQELVEKETYAQRQSLLEELRAIKQREADLRREAEINRRAAKMEEDKRKALEENLKMREASVSNIETTYENKLKEETRRFELDYEARLAKRLNELEQREAKIRAEQRSMVDEKGTLKSVQEQLLGKTNHILELENLLKEAKGEAASAANRSDALNERMRTMIDYPTLKESNTILKRDLEHAKMRIAELGSEYKGEQTRHEELIKQLSERMSRPSPELQALRNELQQTREQLSHEKATIQHMEAQWNARLQEEMDANKDLRHRLSEQTNEMSSLMRQLADLKLALRQTQTALNNNIFHVDRSLGPAVDNTNQNTTLGEDIYMDTSLHRNTLGPELLLANSNRYQLPLDDSNSGDDSGSQGGDSIAFIEQTKARFRQLDREAEHLEHNYQDLQHRMSGIGGSYQSPGAQSLFSRPTDMQMSRIPDQTLHQPPDGSRQDYRESAHSSHHSNHPRTHSGPHKSKSKKDRSSDDRTRLPSSTGNTEIGQALGRTDRRMSEKRTRSSSSSSSSSSMSLKLKTSDLGGPDLKDDSMWMSPRATTGAVKEGNLPHLSDHSMPQALSDDEQKREEERKRREEEEGKRVEMERIRKEEEVKRQHEEEKMREETRKAEVDEDERRRRIEEEEEEQRAWEEKRRKKDEERRRKEQEAREREQKMLMELQKQESAGASNGVPEPKQDNSAGLNDTYELGDSGKKEEQEEKKEKEEEDGVKIDPVMQRYMMMVQQRKQQQDATPATQEPTVIPDSPSISHKSDGSISGEEMEGEVEDPASVGKASDNDDDPFGDW